MVINMIYVVVIPIDTAIVRDTEEVNEDDLVSSVTPNDVTRIIQEVPQTR